MINTRREPEMDKTQCHQVTTYCMNVLLVYCIIIGVSGLDLPVVLQLVFINNGRHVINSALTVHSVCLCEERDSERGEKRSRPL